MSMIFNIKVFLFQNFDGDIPNHVVRDKGEDFSYEYAIFLNYIIKCCGSVTEESKKLFDVLLNSLGIFDFNNCKLKNDYNCEEVSDFLKKIRCIKYSFILDVIVLFRVAGFFDSHKLVFCNLCDALDLDACDYKNLINTSLFLLGDVEADYFIDYEWAIEKKIGSSFFLFVKRHVDESKEKSNFFVDSKKKLMWTSGFVNESCVIDKISDGEKFSIKDANKIIKKINELQLFYGKNDWRIPTVEELGLVPRKEMDESKVMTGVWGYSKVRGEFVSIDSIDTGYIIIFSPKPVDMARIKFVRNYP